MVYFCVGLLKFLSFATFWTSWLWMSIPFPRLDKFPAIISSRKISVPFLSSTGMSGWGCISLMLSLRLTLFHFLSCSDWVSSTALLQVDWFFFFFFHPASSSLLLNPSRVFFSLLILFWSSVISVWYSLAFSLCWSSDSIHPVFSQVYWASFQPWRSALYQGNYSSPFHEVFFSWFSFALLVGTYSSVSSLCLTLCWFLCIK